MTTISLLSLFFSISLETNCTSPQPSTSSALISRGTLPVVTSSLIDTVSTIVTPTESTTLGKCY